MPDIFEDTSELLDEHDAFESSTEISIPNQTYDWDFEKVTCMKPAKML